MNPYGESTMVNNGALDFTAAAMNQNSNEKNLEQPVLDLSCKKSTKKSHDQDPSSFALSPISCDDLSNSPIMENNQKTEICRNRNNHDDYSDNERKSPFEGRQYMVTPPSETDSPRKLKYETIYDENSVNETVKAVDSIENRYPMLPTNCQILSTNVPILSLNNVGITSNVTTNQNVGHQTINSMMQLAVTTSGSPSSISHEITSPMGSPEICKKAPRPFKAYPKDPLSLTMGTAEMMYDPNSNEAYSEFRKRMLDSVRRTNEGTNIKMRRVTKSPGLPTSTMDDKDATYWERRRKNNEAAKRSRDARRAKEDEIAIRAAFLEQENMKLKYELVALRNETAKLRCMVYTT